MRDALAIYYFPGMWEWDRAIVRPVFMEAFLKSMRGQREARQAESRLTPEEEAGWELLVEAGEDALLRYFEWAPTIDRFSPVRVETEYDVLIPDPVQPELALTGEDGQGIHYRGRIEALVIDDAEAYWLITNRVVRDQWEDLEQLLLDAEGLSECWAWETDFVGMRIAGNIYNELRLHAKPAADGRRQSGGLASATAPESAAMADPHKASRHRRMYARGEPGGERVTVTGNESIRRTQIRRTPDEMTAVGWQLAQEAQDLTSRSVRVYPSPAPEKCRSCVFLQPCLAMSAGQDAADLLAVSYVRGEPGGPELGRLGTHTYSYSRGAIPPDKV
jgi:hypothetical protein